MSLTTEVFKFSKIHLGNELDKIPACPGVYIVGVMCKVHEDGTMLFPEDKASAKDFIPLYVGQTGSGKDAGTLNRRISAHQQIDGGYLNTKKELFKLEGNNKQLLMSNLRSWNAYWHNWEKIKKTGTSAKVFAKKEDAKNTLFSNCPDLLYFPDSPQFWEGKLKLKSGIWRGNGNKPITSHSMAIKRLQLFPLNPKAVELLDEINKTKGIISDYFAASFWANCNDKDREITQIESATKFALETIGSFTHGHVYALRSKYVIDLSNLKSELDHFQQLVIPIV